MDIQKVVIYNNILKIITPFAKEYDIMLLDFGEPGNKSSTLNKTVSYLSEEIKYVALLDVDDVWYPNKLEIQIPLLQKGYDIVGTKCQYFGKNTVIPEIPNGDFSNCNFKLLNPIINSSVIIHTPLAYWNENTTNGLEDYELWLNLHKRSGIKFYNCIEVLIKHRIHNTSAFNNNNTKYLSELLAKY
jgi:glycosyltransferase involved in cell wall biosynthesis